MARAACSSDSSQPWIKAVTEAGCCWRRGRAPALGPSGVAAVFRRVSDIEEASEKQKSPCCAKGFLQRQSKRNPNERYHRLYPRIVALRRKRRLRPTGQVQLRPRHVRHADRLRLHGVRRTRARGQPKALASDVRPSDADISEGVRPIGVPVCRTFDVMRGFAGGAVG